MYDFEPRRTLIGSRALKHVVPEFTIRKNADWDIIGEGEHGFDHLNNDNMSVLYFHDRSIQYDGESLRVMSLRGQAIIKRSHLWRDWFFDKHIAMYHRWILPNLDSPLTDRDWKVIRYREKLTREAYPQPNPSLKQTNDGFFEDGVPKKYDHDMLHELVAAPNRPLYEKLKWDDRQDLAWCEKALWDVLPHEDKVRCVSEECNVIALERFLIPTQFRHSERLAYYKALKKVCTTLTSGWFRDFAIDNFPQILLQFDKKILTRIGHELGEI